MFYIGLPKTWRMFMKLYRTTAEYIWQNLQLSPRITKERKVPMKSAGYRTVFSQFRLCVWFGSSASAKRRWGSDYFLFESKKGFCIHYASAMVILARACGLPARYSEGYVADEFDSGTGRFIVRDKDAMRFLKFIYRIWMDGLWTHCECQGTGCNQPIFSKVKSVLTSFRETVVNFVELCRPG